MYMASFELETHLGEHRTSLRGSEGPRNTLSRGRRRGSGEGYALGASLILSVVLLTVKSVSFEAYKGESSY